MNESESSTVRPVIKKGEGWQNKLPKRKKSEEGSAKTEVKLETATREPVPLPFGKIDLLAY